MRNKDMYLQICIDIVFDCVDTFELKVWTVTKFTYMQFNCKGPIRYLNTFLEPLKRGDIPYTNYYLGGGGTN